MLIVSCTKEDLENVFGGKKDCNHIDTAYNENNGNDDCLTCGEGMDSVIIYDGGEDSIYVDPNDNSGKDSVNDGGYEYFDSIYKNPNYDPNKDGLLLTQ